MIYESGFPDNMHHPRTLLKKIILCWFLIIADIRMFQYLYQSNICHALLIYFYYHTKDCEKSKNSQKPLRLSDDGCWGDGRYT